MKVLFLGGTGIISTACTQLAVARGFHITLLNRARRPALPGTHQITADIADPAATAAALGNQIWDAVVDFIAFTPAEIEQRIALFRGRTGQYVFISSASAYQKPLTHYLITESPPLANPFWDYSRNKAAGEERLLRALREENFPVTTVRPSLTYGDTVVPLAEHLAQELHGGGPDAAGEAGDCARRRTVALDHYAQQRFRQGAGWVARPARRDRSSLPDYLRRGPDLEPDLSIYGGSDGRSDPSFDAHRLRLHTACVPEDTGTLLGDKSHSAVFDNTKIKHFVPDFVCTLRFRDGIARTIAWFDADPARRQIDEEANTAWDRLIAAYECGLEAARREFGR
jgi:uncharacterized protein YbjT (DUF2867 family)